MINTVRYKDCRLDRMLSEEGSIICNDEDACWSWTIAILIRYLVDVEYTWKVEANIPLAL